jgi:hypothetical protein
MLAHMNLVMSDEEFKKLMLKYDPDNNGIDYREFISSFAQHIKGKDDGGFSSWFAKDNDLDPYASSKKTQPNEEDEGWGDLAEQWQGVGGWGSGSGRCGDGKPKLGAGGRVAVNRIKSIRNINPASASFGGNQVKLVKSPNPKRGGGRGGSSSGGSGVGGTVAAAKRAPQVMAWLSQQQPQLQQQGQQGQQQREGEAADRQQALHSPASSPGSSRSLSASGRSSTSRMHWVLTPEGAMERVAVQRVPVPARRSNQTATAWQQAGVEGEFDSAYATQVH